MFRLVAVARKWTRVSLPLLALTISALISISCSRDPREQADPPAAPAAVPARATSTAPVARPRIVVLGDSLTAGLGLAQAESYPARLQQKIDGAGLSFEIINAGVSGDTSAGGVRRLDWSLDGDVRILILELGANCLRIYCVPPRWFLDLAQEMGLKVFLDVSWPKNLAFVGDPGITEQACQAVRESARACGNHPAVFAISVVNEIPPDIVRFVGRRATSSELVTLSEISRYPAPQINVWRSPSAN